MLKFDQKDFKDMLAFQAKLAEVLRRGRSENLHVVLAIFAMLRLQRELLNMMKDGERQTFIDTLVVPFIQGEEVDEKTVGRIITLH